MQGVMQKSLEVQPCGHILSHYGKDLMFDVCAVQNATNRFLRGILALRNN